MAKCIIERPDGTRVTVVVNIRPLKDQQGQITGAINCFYDITERKQAEEALRDSDRRKTRVPGYARPRAPESARTDPVSIEILRRATRKDGIRETVRRALMDPRPLPGAWHRSRFGCATPAGGQMVRLVDDLLDAGRISRGKIDLRRERIELSSVVYHVVDAARPLSERRAGVDRHAAERARVPGR